VYHLQIADCVDVARDKWLRARYLDLPLGMDNTKLMARFRLSNHYLRIELGRWRRPEPEPMHERLCTLCDTGCVQHEHHWTFDCPALQSAREEYPAVFAHGHFTQLRKLFGLQLGTNACFGVARDLCAFLRTVGGIYAPPPAVAQPDSSDAE
jgi:hypothetical protein